MSLQPHWGIIFQTYAVVLIPCLNLFQMGVNQLSLLVERLENIFKTVNPDSDNLNVHGPEIRNLILLAATEAEAQMKGVLKANNYTTNKKHWNTNDFARLKAPLKLDNYSLNRI